MPPEKIPARPAAAGRKAAAKGNAKDGARTSAKGSAAERAYWLLREEIIQRLPPGSPLDEEMFSGLGLSRTPVREALVRLAGERLVQLLPNRGARVAPMGWVEIREHLEGLDIMQRLVTRWAAVRRTAADLALIEKERIGFEQAAAKNNGVAMTEANLRFHTAIGAACHNSIFDRCYRQILTEGLRVDRHAMFEESFRSGDTFHSHVDRIIADHAEMTDAIRSGDPDRAEASARAHAELARKRIGEAVAGPIHARLEISVDLSGAEK